MKDEDEKLDRVLGQWHCQIRHDPQLEGAVWRRISEREETSWALGEVIPFGRSWAGPALAASIALGAILAGVGAAEFRLQTTPQLFSAQDAREAYFESINPVALARHDHR